MAGVFVRVPDALRRETLLRRAGPHATTRTTRDGPRLSSASLRAALRPEHESSY